MATTQLNADQWPGLVTMAQAVAQQVAPSAGGDHIAIWSNVAAILVAAVTGLFAWLASRATARKEVNRAGEERAVAAILSQADRDVFAGIVRKLESLEKIVSDRHPDERLYELLVEMRAELRVMAAKFGPDSIWSQRRH